MPPLPYRTKSQTPPETGIYYHNLAHFDFSNSYYRCAHTPSADAPDSLNGDFEALLSKAQEWRLRHVTKVQVVDRSTACVVFDIVRPKHGDRICGVRLLQHSYAGATDERCWSGIENDAHGGQIFYPSFPENFVIVRRTDLPDDMLERIRSNIWQRHKAFTIRFTDTSNPQRIRGSVVLTDGTGYSYSIEICTRSD